MFHVIPTKLLPVFDAQRVPVGVVLRVADEESSTRIGFSKQKLLSLFARNFAEVPTKTRTIFLINFCFRRMAGVSSQLNLLFTLYWFFFGNEVERNESFLPCPKMPHSPPITFTGNWKLHPGLTHYRPALPFRKKKYFTKSFQFSIVTIQKISTLWKPEI